MKRSGFHTLVERRHHYQLPMEATHSNGGRLAVKVQLGLSCFDLQNKWKCFVTLHLDGAQEEYGRTETVRSTRSPQFTSILELDYNFEEEQRLWFRLHDADLEEDRKKSSELGLMTCLLSELVNSVSTHPLKNNYTKEVVASLRVVGEEVCVEEPLLDISAQFGADGLDKKDFFSKSDPYLEFSRENKDGSFSVIFKTEVCMNCHDPVWNKFCLTSQQLCNNNTERTIRVTCYDWDSDGSHDLIGYFQTTLAQLVEGGEREKFLRTKWDCIHPGKLEKKKYKNSGTVRLISFKTMRLFRFSDYLRAGCNLSFTVGVDYTGRPSCDPASIHHLMPDGSNVYIKTLKAVANICHYYDSDNQFPAYGFGGKGEISRVFPLNGDSTQPSCVGVAGVVVAYRRSLGEVEMLGQSQFAPIIRKVSEVANGSMKVSHKQYFILLMLTDGVISDMADTKRAIIAASSLPMSIVIVGVGGADFSDLKHLDADSSRLESDGVQAHRDIVQFVSYAAFGKTSDQAITSSVLSEVHFQLEQYMRHQNILPHQLSDSSA